MVYKLTDDPDGVITPVEVLNIKPIGEAEKPPPAIVKEGVKETDPSTSTQLLGLVYESAGLSFAVIVMVKDEVFVHVPAVVYDTVYVPGVEVDGVISPVTVFNVKLAEALKPPQGPLLRLE